VVERQPAADQPDPIVSGPRHDGCVPMGWPFASRHVAWRYRIDRRNAVIAGSRGTRSSGSQQCAVMSSSCVSSRATSRPYARVEASERAPQLVCPAEQYEHMFDHGPAIGHPDWAVQGA
jgi:hypothetical protein